MAFFPFSGAVKFSGEFTVVPTDVTAGDIVESTFTIPGLRLGMFPFVNFPSLEADLGVVGVKITAANTLKVRLFNPTADPIDPASQVLRVICL